MTNRPKQIGTAGETAVVRHAQPNGFPGAERLALHGTLDEGDATLCPGVGVEVKSGKAAEAASDAQITAWLAEAEQERVNRGADVMLLVTKRKGKGAASVGQWWAHLPGWTFAQLAYSYHGQQCYEVPAVRITYDDALTLLRRAGYGDEL
jgi:hypothetical protein